MTCNIHIGSIYRVDYPFIDLSKTEMRSALALTEADERGDAYFAFITTKPYSGIDCFHLKESDFVDGVMLPLSSYLMLNKTMLLNQSVVGDEAARLNVTMMKKVARLHVKKSLPLWLLQKSIIFGLLKTVVMLWELTTKINTLVASGILPLVAFIQPITLLWGKAVLSLPKNVN